VRGEEEVEIGVKVSGSYWILGPKI